MDAQTDSPKAQTWQHRALQSLQRGISRIGSVLQGCFAWVKSAAGQAKPWAQQNTHLIGVGLALLLLLASLVFVWQHCSSCRSAPGASKAISDVQAPEASAVFGQRIDQLEADLAQLQAAPAISSGRPHQAVRHPQPASAAPASQVTTPIWGTTDLDRAIAQFPSSTLEKTK